MKPDTKNIVLFLHEDSKEKCLECLAACELLDNLNNHLKKRGIYLKKIKDNSFQEIFIKNNFPLLRIEGMPPEHYSGLNGIKDYLESFKGKYN